MVMEYTPYKSIQYQTVSVVSAKARCHDDDELGEVALDWHQLGKAAAASKATYLPNTYEPLHPENRTLHSPDITQTDFVSFLSILR